VVLLGPFLEACLDLFFVGVSGDAEDLVGVLYFALGRAEEREEDQKYE
jgi:hypothetical protein